MLAFKKYGVESYPLHHYWKYIYLFYRKKQRKYKAKKKKTICVKHYEKKENLEKIWVKCICGKRTKIWKQKRIEKWKTENNIGKFRLSYL